MYIKYYVAESAYLVGNIHVVVRVVCLLVNGVGR